MPLSEFQIIARYFAHLTAARPDVALGVGDDCALLRVPAGMELAVTTDTMAEGVHFPADTPAASVGYRALAVNLSDLAAMGAEPAWVTLALSLPAPDPEWLAGFAEGFASLADAHGVALVGGDTTRGALGITVQAMGLVPAGAALRRAGARPGDRIGCTGTLGDAGAGLALARGRLEAAPPTAAWLRGRLDRPQPRVAAGLALRGRAHAVIDLSDGLAADLGHILEASGVGATVDADALPVSEALRAAVPDPEARTALAAAAGDDYELCFTMAPEAEAIVQAALAEVGCPATVIGEVEAEPGLRWRRAGRPWQPATAGYDHFGGGG